MGNANIDLFKYYDQMPSELERVCDKYCRILEESEGDLYKICADFLVAVKLIGYTFEYDLSAEPFDLRKLATN
jgi:hypothetical protein